LRLKDYNSSEPIFVDANIYLDFALANPQTYRDVENFLERIELLDITAVTTPSVLDEVSYVLLMHKGAKILNTRDHKKIGNKIKGDADFALRCYGVVDKFKELLKTLKGLETYSVNKNDYEKAVVLGSLYRLLPTDALHASVMENNNILNIATRDRDFNRIESFRVWMPL
jgi:predicted nucleic acid-binding protein